MGNITGVDVRRRQRTNWSRLIVSAIATVSCPELALNPFLVCARTHSPGKEPVHRSAASFGSQCTLPIGEGVQRFYPLVVCSLATRHSRGQIQPPLGVSSRTFLASSLLCFADLLVSQLHAHALKKLCKSGLNFWYWYLYPPRRARFGS